MVEFKFFVHCPAWTSGGYENKHFAHNAKAAREIVSKWNKERPGSVSLVSITEITEEEFSEDFTGCL